MRVTAWKNIDVEVEVEVVVEDVLSEFWDRCEAANGEYWRQVCPVLVSVTKILAQVKDETIKAMPEASRKIMCERLMTQAARYDSAP